MNNIYADIPLLIKVVFQTAGAEISQILKWNWQIWEVTYFTLQNTWKYRYIVWSTIISFDHATYGAIVGEVIWFSDFSAAIHHARSYE